jgi:hypothetical protein
MSDTPMMNESQHQVDENYLISLEKYNKYKLVYIFMVLTYK